MPSCASTDCGNYVDGSSSFQHCVRFSLELFAQKLFKLKNERANNLGPPVTNSALAEA